jgi:acetate kinase
MRDSGLILALNSGSSSLKFALYAKGETDEVPVLTGSATGIGRDDGELQILADDGTPILQKNYTHESQGEALATLAAELSKHGRALPVAVGHRVVHGGPNLRCHQVITDELLYELQAATHFAPLHIPQALELISSAKSIFGSSVHFACFDDAFHSTLPEVAYHLPLPSRYLDLGIRRYGFHGLSYASLVHRLAADLPTRAIFAHLGNGASLCALRDGKSMDTTMCFTPTGGIPMGTRSGDVDPGVVLFLLRNEKLDADQLEQLLNHESGLFALSAGESDVKTLESRAQAGDPQAILALYVFATAVRKSIGAYVALLGGVDMLVFTGGIGEHSSRLRSAITQELGCIGVTPDKIKVLPADEERQIARECRAMMSEQRQQV